MIKSILKDGIEFLVTNKRTKKMFNKLAKRNNEFTIENIANGYVIAVGGRSAEDDWITEKVYVSNMDQLMNAIRTLDEMPFDD
jgi:hypothetical protein